MEYEAQSALTRPEKAYEQKPGVLRKASAAVASHSSGALALIVLLVLTVVYLYARQAGWFGLGQELQPRLALPSRSAKRESWRRDDAEDAETSRLIDSINNAPQRLAGR